MSSPAEDNAMLALRHRLLHGERDEPLPDDVSELRRSLHETHDSHMAFSIWKRLRSLGETPTDAEAAEVFGVAGEIGASGGSALIFGLKDGSCSMYTSTGGGVIGGGGHERVREACAELIETAGDYTGELPLAVDLPLLEQQGEFRICLMTPRGLQAAEVRVDELTDGRHRLWPLFRAWNDLVTQLRLTDPKEFRAAKKRSAAAWTNCLLTLMWEKSLQPHEIVVGEPLPDLSRVASGADDQQLLDQIELPLDEIDPADVIFTLKRLAGYRWYRPFRKSGVLNAKLCQSDNRVLDVSYLIENTTGHRNGRGVLVSRST